MFWLAILKLGFRLRWWREWRRVAPAVRSEVRQPDRLLLRRVLRRQVASLALARRMLASWDAEQSPSPSTFLWPLRPRRRGLLLRHHTQATRNWTGGQGLIRRSLGCLPTSGIVAGLSALVVIPAAMLIFGGRQLSPGPLNAKLSGGPRLAPGSPIRQPGGISAAPRRAPPANGSARHRQGSVSGSWRCQATESGPRVPGLLYCFSP